MMVKVFPSNENIVFVGGTNLFRSDDGFASSTRIAQIGGYNPGFTTPRTYRYQIGRAHVRTPVTEKSRMPSSA